MRIIIMCGISGSGKSTYVKKHFPLANTISVDHYLEYKTEHNSPESRYSIKELRKAHGVCLAQFAHKLKYAVNDDIFVIDNANTTVLGIAPYAALADAYNIEPEIIILDCDPEVAYKRNQHNISRKDIVAQYERISLMKERWSSWWPKPKTIKVT